MANKKNAEEKRKFMLPATAALVLLVALALLITPQGGKKETFSETDSLTIPLSSVSQNASFYPIVVNGTEMEVLAIRTASGEIRTAFNTCQSVLVLDGAALRKGHSASAVARHRNGLFPGCHGRRTGQSSFGQSSRRRGKVPVMDWRGLYSLYGRAPSANRGGRAEWRAAAAKLSNRSAAESEQCEGHSLLSHSDEFFCTSVYRFPPSAVRHRPSPYCDRTVLQSDLADRRRGTAKILREISKDGGYHHGNLICPLCGQSCHPTRLTDLVSKKLSGST